jgi:transposase
MYSLDFRKRVFAIKKKEKLTFEQTSKRFGVGMRTLFAWQRRLAPKIKRNKPATKIDMEKLKKDIKKRPDAYQYERAQLFGVTAWAIGMALRRLSVTHKKNSVSPQAR